MGMVCTEFVPFLAAHAQLLRDPERAPPEPIATKTCGLPHLPCEQAKGAYVRETDCSRHTWASSPRSLRKEPMYERMTPPVASEATHACKD